MGSSFWFRGLVGERMDQQITNRVRQIVAEQLALNLEEVKPESAIRDIEGDSLDLVEITIAIEDEYGFDFPKDLGQFKTVQDVINYTQQHHKV